MSGSSDIELVYASNLSFPANFIITPICAWERERNIFFKEIFTCPNIEMPSTYHQMLWTAPPYSILSISLSSNSDSDYVKSSRTASSDAPKKRSQYTPPNTSYNTRRISLQKNVLCTQEHMYVYINHEFSIHTILCTHNYIICRGMIKMCEFFLNVVATAASTNNFPMMIQGP